MNLIVLPPGGVLSQFFGVFGEDNLVDEGQPGSGVVIAFEPNTGDIRWRAEMVECAPLQPALDAERVFLPCSDGAVYALDRQDGSNDWRADTGGAPYRLAAAEGLVFTDSIDPENQYGVKVDYFPQRRYEVGIVAALDAESGAEAWRADFGEAHAFVTYAVGRSSWGRPPAEAPGPTTSHLGNWSRSMR